jgi:hypothetical protein
MLVFAVHVRILWWCSKCSSSLYLSTYGMISVIVTQHLAVLVSLFCKAGNQNDVSGCVWLSVKTLAVINGQNKLGDDLQGSHLGVIWGISPSFMCLERLYKIAKNLRMAFSGENLKPKTFELNAGVLLVGNVRLLLFFFPRIVLTCVR